MPEQTTQAPTPITIGKSNEMPATPGSNFVSAKPGEGYGNQPVVKGWEEVEATQPEQQESPPEAQPEKPKVNTKKLADIAKAERKLAQREKEINEAATKAKQYEEALKSPDLVEALSKMGLPQDKVFQAYLDAALKDPKTPKSKEETQQDERDRKLQEAYDKISKLEQERAQEKEDQAMFQIKSQYIDPVISNNTDKYEVLLDIFGSKEAVVEQVYKELNDEFSRSGQTYSPEEAADAMEAYWANTFEQSLQKAKSLKKFSKHFTQEQQNSQDTPIMPVLRSADSFGSALAAKIDNQVALEKPSATRTLTNNMSHGTTSQIQPYSPAGTASVTDRNLARFLKSHGL